MTVGAIIGDPDAATFILGSDILYLIDYSISVLYSSVDILFNLFQRR
jgi:hypothetical protein